MGSIKARYKGVSATRAVEMEIFRGLAVFDARSYIPVRRLDERAYRPGACGGSRSQLHMAHDFAGNGASVMQKLPDFVPAFSHRLKPLMRDSSQFTWMRIHPCTDGRIPLDSAVESQQFGSHLRLSFSPDLRLRNTLTWRSPNTLPRKTCRITLCNDGTAMVTVRALFT